MSRVHVSSLTLLRAHRERRARGTKSVDQHSFSPQKLTCGEALVAPLNRESVIYADRTR
jgi:hypothetical protein